MDFSRTVTDFAAGDTPAAAVFDGLSEGGYGAKTETSSVGSITAAESTIISRDFTAIASRLVVIFAECNIESTVADDRFRMRVKEGATTLGFRDIVLGVANIHQGITCIVPVTSFSAGSHTITVTLERVSWTGTGQATLASTSPAVLVILGAGPNS